MARIFLALSIILTLASGVLSIQTRTKVKGICEDLSTAKKEVIATSSERDKAKAAAKASDEKATDAIAKKEQTETQLTAAKGEAEKATKDLADAKTQLEDKSKALDAAKAALVSATTNQPVAAVAPDADAKVKELQAGLEEQKTLAKGFEEKMKVAEATKNVLEQEKKVRENAMARPGLEGTVLAVNPSWNFVVLSMGDHQGVIPNSTMIVKRGSAMVCKVRVTSVEPATSIADILPGANSRFGSVQPGDVVIFGGSGS